MQQTHRGTSCVAFANIVKPVVFHPQLLGIFGNLPVFAIVELDEVSKPAQHLGSLGFLILDLGGMDTQGYDQKASKIGGPHHWGSQLRCLRFKSKPSEQRLHMGKARVDLKRNLKRLFDHHPQMEGFSLAANRIQYQTVTHPKNFCACTGGQGDLREMILWPIAQCRPSYFLRIFPETQGPMFEKKQGGIGRRKPSSQDARSERLAFNLAGSIGFCSRLFQDFRNS